MTNEAISLLGKVVKRPETNVSVNHFITGKTYSFPAMVEIQTKNNFAYVSDIRGLYDTRGINSFDDVENYQYVRFYIECIYTLSLGIPSTMCSIRMDGVEDQLCTYTIPLGTKPQTPEHKLVSALIKKCRQKVLAQEKADQANAIKCALMSVNQDLQYN